MKKKKETKHSIISWVPSRRAILRGDTREKKDRLFVGFKKTSGDWEGGEGEGLTAQIWEKRKTREKRKRQKSHTAS